MRAYDLTVTGSLTVSGSTTLTGDITYDDLTATGNIITTGANKVISGSSTSTGSFGSVHTAGNVGIGTTDPTTKLDIGGENAPRITFSPAASGQTDNGGIWFRETAGHGMYGDGSEYGVYQTFNGSDNTLDFIAVQNSAEVKSISIQRSGGAITFGASITGTTGTFSGSRQTNNIPKG